MDEEKPKKVGLFDQFGLIQLLFPLIQLFSSFTL
jgi:hypothetical protein